MKTSWRGVRNIALEEAVVLQAYADGPGYSIGVGHFGAKAGDEITLDQALELLAADLQPREATIDKLVQIPLTQNETDALISTCFNRGNRVRSIAERINAGDRNGAMLAMMSLCTDSNGTFLVGLAARRLREARLFLLNDYGDPARKVKLFHGDPRDPATLVTEFEFPA